MTEPTTDLLNEFMLPLAKVMAKGRRVREVESLANAYGGQVSEWAKKRGPVFIFEDEAFEFHWYERPGLRIEIEPRKVNEP